MPRNLLKIKTLLCFLNFYLEKGWGPGEAEALLTPLLVAPLIITRASVRILIKTIKASRPVFQVIKASVS